MRRIDPIEALLGGRSARPRQEISEGDLTADQLPGRTVLAKSALLHCPSRNGRHYQTQLSAEPGGDGNLIFEARSNWGPKGRVDSQSKVLYAGPDLHSAVQAANEMIEKKLGREYTPLKPGEPTRILASTALQALRKS